MTDDELWLRDKARLELLISELMEVVHGNAGGSPSEQLDRLTAFMSKTTFEDLQEQASKAHDAASSDSIEQAQADLSKIVAKLSPAGQIFKDAAQIAKSGKKELLFPRLAATTAQALEQFSALKKAIDSVAESVDDIEELGDIPDAAKNVLDALKTLKDSVKET